MAFNGHRKGTRVSDYLNRLSDAKLIAKISRFANYGTIGARTQQTDAKVFNIAYGILKSRNAKFTGRFD